MSGPIILRALNPTDKAECSAEQATLVEGQGAVRGRSSVPRCDADRPDFHPGQANNFYISPRSVSHLTQARPRRLTDACFIAAAHGECRSGGPDLRAKGMLFPSQADILETAGDDRHPRPLSSCSTRGYAQSRAARHPNMDRRPALQARSNGALRTPA